MKTAKKKPTVERAKDRVDVSLDDALPPGARPDAKTRGRPYPSGRNGIVVLANARTSLPEDIRDFIGSGPRKIEKNGREPPPFGQPACRLESKARMRSRSPGTHR